MTRPKNRLSLVPAASAVDPDLEEVGLEHLDTTASNEALEGPGGGAYLRRPAPKVTDCQGCQDLIPWVARVGIDWTCGVCLTRLLAPLPRGPKLHVPDPVADLDLLARWAPDLEGHALPLEPPPGVEEAERTGRARLDSVESTITVHCALSSQRYATAPSGRPDHVDEDAKSFGQAVTVLRRLDSVLTMPNGHCHALVLLAAFFANGQAARDRWWDLDEEGVPGDVDPETDLEAANAAAKRKDGDRALGFDWYLGVLLANVEQRLTWLYTKPYKLGRGMARMHGSRLLAEAVLAYRSSEPGVVAGRARIDLGRARRVLDRLAADAHRDIRETTLERKRKSDERVVRAA